jgi:RNA polymerase sigma-70 factor (ECF subfamily)
VDDDDRTDRELVDAARAGEPGAFEVLYARYQDWVGRLAVRMTGSREEALDVFQDTFAYVLQKLPDLELRVRFSSFVYPVVCNLARMRGRQRSRRPRPLEVEPSVEVPVGQGLAGEDLALALACLPAGQRAVLLRRFVDGLSLEEIAAALEIPLGTVKSRLHNALAALRRDPRTQDYFLNE